ncbi:MAG: transcription antitermination factor NusB [Terriglobales bacterium]
MTGAGAPPAGAFAHRQPAREAALQMLYALEVGGQTREQVEAWFEPQRRMGLAAHSFARELLGHTLARREELDQTLARHLTAWRPERLGAVDRCLLQLAAQELTAEEWIPAAVVINEYLRLAKKFSQPEVVGLVHGVLNAIAAARRSPEVAPDPAAAARPER